MSSYSYQQYIVCARNCLSGQLCICLISISQEIAILPEFYYLQSTEIKWQFRVEAISFCSCYKNYPYLLQT